MCVVLGIVRVLGQRWQAIAWQERLVTTRFFQMPFSLFLCVCEFILVLCVRCFRNSKGFRSDLFNAMNVILLIVLKEVVKLMYAMFLFMIAAVSTPLLACC